LILGIDASDLSILVDGADIDGDTTLGELDNPLLPTVVRKSKGAVQQREEPSNATEMKGYFSVEKPFAQEFNLIFEKTHTILTARENC
jgi:hypothetical protein